MEKTMSNHIAPRNRFLDLLKGIAIILVVFGHCIQYGSGDAFLSSSSFFDNPIFKLIYSFHMPLFAMVSGYLFYYSVEKRRGFSVIVKQFKGLCVPVIAWTVTVEVIKLAIRVLSSGAQVGPSWFVALAITCLNSHWFIWAIFWCSMAVVLNRKLFRDHVLVYLAIFLILPICPNIYNSNMYFFLYPFFIGGYVFHKYGGNQRWNALDRKWKCCAGIAAIVVWVTLLAFFEQKHFIYTTHISILGKEPIEQLSIDMYRWIIGFAGSMVALVVVYYISKGPEWLLQIITTLGRHTIGIYLVSSYLNVHVLAILTGAFSLNYLVIGFESILMLAACTGASLLLKKYTITRVLYLGGR